MNIKYEAILERAVQRQLAIKAFATKLETLGMNVYQLQDALTYLSDLGVLVKNLDDEARSMLGTLPTRAMAVKEAADRLLREPQNSWHSIQGLLDALGEV